MTVCRPPRLLFTAQESVSDRHRMVPSRWDCEHSIGLKRSAAKLRPRIALGSIEYVLEFWNNWRSDSESSLGHWMLRFHRWALDEIVGQRWLRIAGHRHSFPKERR